MSKELVSEIDIDAAPSTVWGVLTDFAAYGQWNPFIVRADGIAEKGSRLDLRMQPASGSAVTLKPVVLEVRPAEELRWLGRLWIPGLMDAEHSFLLTQTGVDGCRLVQRERFSGVLVPLLAHSLDKGTLPAFGAMNEALKQRAEQAVTNA